jgi:hypothetical protein
MTPAWSTFFVVLAIYRRQNMVIAVPWIPNVAAWMALLSTCRIHGNVEMT